MARLLPLPRPPGLSASAAQSRPTTRKTTKDTGIPASPAHLRVMKHSPRREGGHDAPTVVRVGNPSTAVPDAPRPEGDLRRPRCFAKERIAAERATEVAQ